MVRTSGGNDESLSPMNFPEARDRGSALPEHLPSNGTSHLRRTDIGIGCIDPVTDHQPSVQTEGRIGTDHDVHLRDLSVVRYMCDRVAVMYLSSIVEIADSEEIYTNPGHFYTKALLSRSHVCGSLTLKKKRDNASF